MNYRNHINTLKPWLKCSYCGKIYIKNRTLRHAHNDQHLAADILKTNSLRNLYVLITIIVKLILNGSIDIKSELIWVIIS